MMIEIAGIAIGNCLNFLEIFRSLQIIKNSVRMENIFHYSPLSGKYSPIWTKNAVILENFLLNPENKIDLAVRTHLIRNK